MILLIQHVHDSSPPILIEMLRKVAFGVIVEIVRDTQPCTSKKSAECPRYGGAQDELYVLELNAGAAAKLGLRVGDVLSF